MNLFLNNQTMTFQGLMLAVLLILAWSPSNASTKTDAVGFNPSYLDTCCYMSKEEMKKLKSSYNSPQGQWELVDVVDSLGWQDDWPHGKKLIGRVQFFAYPFDHTRDNKFIKTEGVFYNCSVRSRVEYLFYTHELFFSREEYKMFNPNITYYKTLNKKTEMRHKKNHPEEHVKLNKLEAQRVSKLEFDPDYNISVQHWICEEGYNTYNTTTFIFNGETMYYTDYGSIYKFKKQPREVWVHKFK